MSKITIVGCGNMGGAICSAFMRNGHEMTIVDPNKSAVQKYLDKGAHYAESLDKDGGNDFVLINLPSKKIVMSVLNKLPEDYFKGKNFVNTTTASPAECNEMCNYLIEKGARCLDSKIECYPPEVGTEYGFFTYCGNKELFEEIVDTLKSLSPEPWFTGEKYSTSAVLDVAGIETQYALRYAILEGIALAIKSGADVEPWLDMVDQGIPGILKVSRRQFSKAFVEHEYDGSYEEATEASIQVDLHGLGVVKKAFTQSGVNTDFVNQILNKYQEAVDDDLASKEDVAIIHEMLK
jgi:3-hydroxyisobutyrate dehydrogenase-like beta-hydroxyacid dehydrogenase